ncbi:hypothetical protein FHS29_003551 [Saccharothrix tamanrassetensis]|uniref:Uncharacterized protein n=1 Tax=Saccharothrix tamanrassetensis TaxID=1051531 RepID=A0A841CLB7_9PSEU|nr:hypothetical protein [Saccharothrix tamanrassetensis]
MTQWLTVATAMFEAVAAACALACAIAHNRKRRDDE